MIRMRRFQSKLALLPLVLSLANLAPAYGQSLDAPASKDEADPYLWVEDVASPKALAWVKEHNAVSQGELEKAPEFEPIRKRLLTILDSKERIPMWRSMAATITTFGGIRRTSAGCGGAPRWPNTRNRTRDGKR